jgi:hypothetical protein
VEGGLAAGDVVALRDPTRAARTEPAAGGGRTEVGGAAAGDAGR